MPGERCFSPQYKRSVKLEGVALTIDEFEAIRLADLEELTHAQAARLMKVSRPTFTRILASAHLKVADGLVNIKAIKIEGGCCRIAQRGRKNGSRAH
jgi:predicted DNA-binding protein (UPF0251 family)